MTREVVPTTTTQGLEVGGLSSLPRVKPHVYIQSNTAVMITFPITVAYNMKEKKVGCALAQAILGSTFTGGDLGLYFDVDLWELNPTKCQVYTVNSQLEFDFMVKITKEHNVK